MVLSVIFLTLYLAAGLFLFVITRESNKELGLFQYDQGIKNRDLGLKTRLESAFSKRGFLQNELQIIIFILSWPIILLLGNLLSYFGSRLTTRDAHKDINTYFSEESEEVFQVDQQRRMSAFISLTPFKIYLGNIGNILVLALLFALTPVFSLPDTLVSILLAMITLDLLIREFLVTRFDMLKTAVQSDTNRFRFFSIYATLSFLNILFCGFMLFGWDRTTYHIGFDEVIQMTQGLLDYQSIPELIKELTVKSIFFFVFGILLSISVVGNILRIFNYSPGREDHSSKAFHLNNVGNYPRALFYLDKIDPAQYDASIYEELICAHLGLKNWETAQEKAKVLLQINPNLSELHQHFDPTIYLGSRLAQRPYEKVFVLEAVRALVTKLNIKDLYLNHVINRIYIWKTNVPHVFWYKVYKVGFIQMQCPLSFAIHLREVQRYQASNTLINQIETEDPLELFAILCLEYSYLLELYVDNCTDTPDYKTDPELKQHLTYLTEWLEMNESSLKDLYLKLENDQDRLIALSFINLLYLMMTLLSDALKQEAKQFAMELISCLQYEAARQKAKRKLNLIQPDNSIEKIIESKGQVRWNKFYGSEVL